MAARSEFMWKKLTETSFVYQSDLFTVQVYHHLDKWCWSVTYIFIPNSTGYKQPTISGEALDVDQAKDEAARVYALLVAEMINIALGQPQQSKETMH